MTMDRQSIYHKRDRLKQLRAFYHAARLESIARAGEHLGVGAGSVSQHVRRLEAELASRLFHRHGSHIALTSAGKDLYRIATPLVKGMEALPDEFAKTSEKVSGKLRIAAGQASVSYVLPRLLKPFHERYPGVRFHISRSDLGEALRMLGAREVDLVFGAAAESSENIDRHRIFFYNLVLVVPEGHPLAGRELVELEETTAYPTIMSLRGSHHRRLARRFVNQHKLEYDVAVETRGWEVVKSYVEAGLGIAIIPDVCLGPGDKLSVVSLPQHIRGQGYWMYMLRDESFRSPTGEAFIRFVRPPPPPPPPPPIART